MENPRTTQMKQQPFSERSESEFLECHLAVCSSWLLLSDAQQLNVSEKNIEELRGTDNLAAWADLLHRGFTKQETKFKKRRVGGRTMEKLVLGPGVGCGRGEENVRKLRRKEGMEKIASKNRAKNIRPLLGISKGCCFDSGS